MIKHHPSQELIASYVNGDLPASLSIAISIHAEMCPCCQQQIALLTEQAAEQLELSSQPEPDEDGVTLSLDFDAMIDEITDDESLEVLTVSKPREIEFEQTIYQLPNALSHVVLGKSAKVGKLSRARVNLDEGQIHSSLLHINAGGAVPEHTHKGFELTLLLEGSFSDDKGDYNKGDFILLDGDVTHHPVTKDGCLCFTVANDALHFTQGVNKLLNPIGNFIY